MKAQSAYDDRSTRSRVAAHPATLDISDASAAIVRFRGKQTRRLQPKPELDQDGRATDVFARGFSLSNMTLVKYARPRMGLDVWT